MNGNTHPYPELDSHPIDGAGASLMVYDELLRVKKEVSALKKCIRKIAMVSTEALSSKPSNYYNLQSFDFS